MKSNGLMKICFGIVIAIMLPTILEADSIESPPSPRAAIMLLSNTLGTQYGISSSKIKNVLKHESGYDYGAVGDHGKALSCAQFHKETFISYESRYFAENGQHLNYPSCEDQAKLMAWMWATFPHTTQLWTTYRNLYGKISA